MKLKIRENGRGDIISPSKKTGGDLNEHESVMERIRKNRKKKWT